MRDVISKVCPKCGVNRFLDDYYVHSGTPDGRQVVCKACIHANVPASGTSYRNVDVLDIPESD